jgi:IMP dehydrogenase
MANGFYFLQKNVPLQMANAKNKFGFQGVTFDDVLLIPAYSQILPREVSTTSFLTANIQLHIPIVSAAMDTVTESALAIAIAHEGGIGMLHKNMTIEKQAEEVRKVKRAESGMILDPITLFEDATIADALRIMKENKIGGIPVINTNNKLVGIITNRDLRFEKNFKKKVFEVMTKDNLVTAPEGTDFKGAERILEKYKIEKLPVVNKQNKLIGLITYRDIKKLTSRPFASKDKHGRLLVGAAVGITKDTLDRVAALVTVGADVITIDTAHGHSKGVIDMVKLVRKTYPLLNIVAGNVATGAGALALAKAGANAVKVGIGPGSICTTRIVTGAGMPQLTAIYEAKKALATTKVKIIADGGIRYTGDVVKAIAAGADVVMAGSVFAGTEESPGETIIFEGRKFKSYRGMGSIEAMEDGSKDRYFQDVEEDVKKLVPEGIVGRVPFKGSLNEIMIQFVGGLKAGMGYCGAANISQLQKAQFVSITSAGVKESHAHDVVITKEAPNYSR